MAGDEGVAVILRRAVTAGYVVNDLALGVESTHANARVTAFVAEASLVI